MDKQVRLLRRLGAPEELIRSFKEVCAINDSLPPDQRAGYPELLQEQCRRFDFQDVLDDGWLFRPYSVSGKGSRQDSAVGSEASEAPAIEQAYRRGYDQGFAECLSLLQKADRPTAEKRSNAIHAWRVRSLQEFGSYPGSLEKPQRDIFGGRSGITAGVRWRVFERDGRRCVVCGRDASARIELHVDHIVPVSRGGGNSIENLQTLCAPCNLGKSNRI